MLNFSGRERRRARSTGRTQHVQSSCLHNELRIGNSVLGKIADLEAFVRRRILPGSPQSLHPFSHPSNHEKPSKDTLKRAGLVKGARKSESVEPRREAVNRAATGRPDRRRPSIANIGLPIRILLCPQQNKMLLCSPQHSLFGHCRVLEISF
jgi:hypothetical protein